MHWAIPSMGSSILFAVVSVFDKRILAAHVRSLPSFYFVFGCLQVLIGIGAAFVRPWEGAASTSAMVAALVNGLLWGVGLALFFYGIQRLEVSRVVPVFHTFPVSTARMAVFLLDEKLLLVHWLAILVVVAGAGSLALEQGSEKGRSGRALAYLLVFLASVLTGAGTVTNKMALEGMDFWNVFALRQMLLGGVVLLASLRPGILAQVREQLADRRGTTFIVLNEGVLAFFAIYVTLVALDLGPASLVATVMATRPFFVLVFSALLSTRLWHVLDEPLSRDTIVLKSVSTAMIVGGVSLLTLV